MASAQYHNIDYTVEKLNDWPHRLRYYLTTTSYILEFSQTQPCTDTFPYKNYFTGATSKLLDLQLQQHDYGYLLPDQLYIQMKKLDTLTVTQNKTHGFPINNYNEQVICFCI